MDLKKIIKEAKAFSTRLKYGDFKLPNVSINEVDIAIIRLNFRGRCMRKELSVVCDDIELFENTCGICYLHGIENVCYKDKIYTSEEARNFHDDMLAVCAGTSLNLIIEEIDYLKVLKKHLTQAELQLKN